MTPKENSHSQVGRFGVFNYFLVFVSGVILGAVILETCAISFVIPVSGCDLILTPTERGVLGAVAFIGMICSSYLWGFLADTKGRKYIILPTLLAAFVMAVCSSFTNNFYIFATFRFLNGFFISAASATIYAYLGEFHSNAQRGRAIMGSSVIFGVMCMVLPLIAWVVINQDWEFYVPYIDIMYKPWRLFLVVCSLPGYLSAIALIFLPESPKFVLGLGDQDRTIQILEKMNRWNNGSQSELGVFEIQEEPESIENRKRIIATKTNRFPLLSSIYNQTAPIFRKPYLNATILICLLQFGVYATANGFYIFFNDIMNKFAIKTAAAPGTNMRICDAFYAHEAEMKALMENGAANQTCITKLEVATLQNDVILEAVYVLGFVVIGMLINKIGKLPILVVLFGVSGAGGIFCTMTDIPWVQMYSFMALMLSGIAGNVISAVTIEVFPTASRGMAISVALMLGRLGSVVGKNIVAFLLADYCESAFFISGASILGCGLLSFFIPKPDEAKPVEITTLDRRTSVLSRV